MEVFNRVFLRVFLAWMPVVAVLGGWPAERAQAVVLEDLYQVSVPVADRSPAARHAALAEAMGLLLVRMTGEPDASVLPGAAPLLAAPERYVEEFRYRQNEIQPPQPVPAPMPPAEGGEEDSDETAAPAPPPFVLEVRFDGRALAQALRDHGLPLWGRERPAVLVWLAVEEEAGGRRLIAADDPSAAREAVEDMARRRGLPLLLPLLDLEDRSRVEVADVWGGFVEQLLPASRRYPVQGVVLGRVQRLAEGAWTGAFVLDFDGDRQEWQVDGADVTAVVGEGLSKLADELALRLAVRPGGVESGETLVRVQEVGDLQAYARTLAYLEGLTQVRRVRVESVRPGMLELSLEVDGGPRALAQAVAVGRVLEPLDGEAGVYRLLP